MDDSALEASLVDMVHELFTGPSRDDLSVNNVRKKVEEKHGLGEGFFSSAEWKGRSKNVIKGKVVCASYSHPLPRPQQPRCSSGLAAEVRRAMKLI